MINVPILTHSILKIHITILHARQLHKKCRVGIPKNAFSRVGAKIWNEMPNIDK